MNELSKEFDMSIVSCKETDCQRKVQARGMCSTHYSYWHRNKAMYARRCEWCTDQYQAQRAESRFCTMRCKNLYANTFSNEARRKGAEMMVAPRVRSWHGHILPARKGLPLVAGPCQYCATYYTAGPGSTYCSTKCRLNAKLKRRYDIRGEFKVTDIVRHSIYSRDKNVCQLCREPVDTSLHYAHAMSATLDHIIPQSWMLIPDHSEANLRLAHRRCNSSRGAKADAA